MPPAPSAEVIDSIYIQWGFLTILGGAATFGLKAIWTWFKDTWWPHHVEIVKAEQKRQDKIFQEMESQEKTIRVLEKTLDGLTRHIIYISEDIHNSLQKVMTALQVNTCLDKKNKEGDS